MSAEQNKKMVYRILTEGPNNLKLADELLHPGFVNYDFPAPKPGIEGWKMVMGMFTTAFPDMQCVIEDEVAEGNKVVSRGYFTGTHRGEFMGIPASGRPVKVKYIDVWTVVDGKLKENWVQMDTVGLMQQIGAMPVPGQG